MKAGPRSPRAGAHDIDPGPVVSLLLFEAGDGLMALPVSEITRLIALPASGRAAEAAAAEAWIDLDEYFGGRRSAGPWLRWGRNDQRAWLRVARVVEVLPYAVRALAPLPAPVRATQRAGAFWAAGLRGDDIFLLVDPARLAGPRED